MTYEDSIKEAFMNIISSCNKLPTTDKNYVNRQLRKITDHINREEQKNKMLVERANGIPKGNYDDALDYFMNILYLHGYGGMDINKIKFKGFIQWFNDHALTNSNYQPKQITAHILETFSQGYILFEIEFEREPNDYQELRDFVLNWEDIIDSRMRKQIKKLEHEFKH